MENEKIKVRTEAGQILDVVVYDKRADRISVVLGEGVHSVKCELMPTRNGLAFVGSVMGREIVYERSREQVQADLDRVNPLLRQSSPKTLSAEFPTLAARVREQTGLPWSRAKSLCAEGRVTIDGERCLDPAARVPPDAVVAVHRHAPKVTTTPLQRDSIVFVDRDVVVVDKPAGVLSVADEEGNKETLVEYTRKLLRRAGEREVGIGVVHRLDRDTSGLIALTRTAEAKRTLAAQFRKHDIDRIYHAIAHGVVHEEHIESDLLPDRGDGLRGSHGHYRKAKGPPPSDSRHAVTYVKPLAQLDGATLVECRLETGRQHQIRIHLAELGHPLVGERVYIRDYKAAPIEAERTMLHARTLGFLHPRTGKHVSFEREPPEDFKALVRRLRGR